MPSRTRIISSLTHTLRLAVGVRRRAGGAAAVRVGAEGGHRGVVCGGVSGGPLDFCGTERILQGTLAGSVATGGGLLSLPVCKT